MVRRCEYRSSAGHVNPSGTNSNAGEQSGETYLRGLHAGLLQPLVDFTCVLFPPQQPLPLSSLLGCLKEREHPSPCVVLQLLLANGVHGTADEVP